MFNLREIIDKAVSTTKSASIGFFDVVKNAVSKTIENTFPTASVIKKATDLIPDNSTAGIVKNTVTGIPKATYDVGKQIVMDVLKVPFSAGEAVGRAITNQPGGIVPGVGGFTSYQSDVAQRVQEGGSQTGAVGGAALDIALNEPLGLAFKPLAFAGSLFMKGPGKKVTSEAFDILAREAKKYKSAEEFVKAQGDVLFHGGTKIDKVGNMNSRWKAFYMTDNADYAKNYGGKNSVLNDMVLDKSAKIADLRKPSDKLLNDIRQIIEPKPTGNVRKIEKPDGTILELPEMTGGKTNRIHSTDEILKGIKKEGELNAYYAEMPEVKEALKELGYDGMITTESAYGSNYGVWNKNVIKTKSQLEDIWNNANLKERGLITSVKNKPGFEPEVKINVSDFYTPATDAEALTNAKYLVDNQIDEAYKLARSEGPATKLSNTVARELVGRLQNEAALLRETNPAQANKLFQDAVDIVENTARRATTQGQAIQSLSLWSKMTPEGIVLHAQKTIDKANDLLPKGKTPIKLTPDKARKLSEEMDRINKLPDGEDKIVGTAEILKEIQDIIPSSMAKKISTLQTIFQLLNPKTTIRNIIGNVGFSALENVSSVFSSTLDAIIPGKKAMAFPSVSVQTKGFKEGIREGYRDAMKGIDTSGIGSKFEVPAITTFKGKDGKLSKVGAALEKTLNVTLKAPDRAFFKAAYDDSLARQMKAKGITEPTEEMMEVATYDGLYRTFQDENATVSMFKGIKQALNKLTAPVFGNTEFGLGDFILKYPKTPANLLNRGLAYTPAGFIKTVYEIARPLIGRGKLSRKDSIESFSRAFVGTAGLFGVGATLYDLGLISTGRNKDSDVADLKSNIGLGEYKINISGLKRFVLSGMDPEVAKIQDGDTLISYDWLQPMAMPVAMGANFSKNKGDTSSYLAQAVDAIGAGSEALAEQPLIKNLTQAFKSGNPSDFAIAVGQSIPQSFVPTIVNQVRQLIDSQKRELYDPRPLTYSLNLAKNRIPFLSESLLPKLNTFGDEVPMYQTGNNIFNVMFNPAFTSKYKPTPEAELVIDLQKETGETKQYPRVVAKNIIVNGESKKLTARERWDMQLYTGTVTKEIFNARANDEAFNNLPTDEKISELSSDLTAIGSAAKAIILGDIPKKKPTKKTMELINAFNEAN